MADFTDALAKFVKSIVSDPNIGLPTVQIFSGAWISTEGVDANLSQVFLPGGGVARFVPKLTSVSGLSAGQPVVLKRGPGIPMHIVGILAGDITLATPVSVDTTPPTTPGAFAVSGTTSSSISLTWTASTDDTGVVAYDVYVNGIYWVTTTGLAATASGLASSTLYTLSVAARDAAGNLSPRTSVPGTTATPSGPPAGTTFTKSYQAVWSRSFNFNSSNEYDSWHGSSCYQGVYGGGNQKSQIGFNSTQIQADLAGATVFVSAVITLTFAHWYSNSGGTAVIGTHSNTTPPPSFTGATTNRVQSGGWTPGLRRPVTLPSGVCDAFANGTVAGVCLGPGVNSSSQYYGYAYGAGSGVYVPTLTLTFVR